MDKLTLKRLFAARGIPQVEFAAVGEDGWRRRCEEMGLPLWVKPSRLGSSVGITRVADLAELDAAVELALRHDPRVIVEASAAAARSSARCSATSRRRPRCRARSSPTPSGTTSRPSTGRAAWSCGSRRRSRAEQTARVRELAAAIFALAGCSGLARCDFFVEPDGEVLVNEINTMPGFTETSVYAKLFEASGIAYPELCDRLVELAVERHRDARSLRVLSLSPAASRR